MVSFTFASLSAIVISALAIAGVQAAPVARDVPTSKCTTIASGQLKTTNGHTFEYATSELRFGGSLEVEFQSCQPNFGGYDGKDGRPIGGHIYVPEAKKCLTAYPSNTGPPFKFNLDNCYFSDDSGQVYSNFIKQSDGKIYYVGINQADGSEIFWGDECSSGYFGVSSSATSGVAEFSCVNNGHVIGLTI
jgi:hypothetical protein